MKVILHYCKPIFNTNIKKFENTGLPNFLYLNLNR